MNVALLAARLLLSAVFAVAGVAKLADQEGSRQALTDFRVPRSFIRPFGILLPLAELATTVLLILRATAWWGALASLSLLVVFLAGIGATMARGQAPDCHCFGQLHPEPVGWLTVVRNAALSLIALFILVIGWADPGASIVGWTNGLSRAELIGIVVGAAVTAILIGEGWLLLHLRQQNSQLLTRIESLEGAETGERRRPSASSMPEMGLPVGSAAPTFRLTGLHRETLTLEALLAPGKPTILIFSDPHCGPCNSLLPEIAKWQREDASQLTVALISRGVPDEHRAKGAEHGLTQVLLQQDREVAELYRSYGTPSAVLIQPDGLIGSTLALGSTQIRQLVDRTMKRLPLAPSSRQTGNGTGDSATRRRGH